MTLPVKRSLRTPVRPQLVLVPEPQRSEILAGWRWRTRKEGAMLPSEMATSHLFYTIRMLWNNSQPQARWVGKVQLYRFNPATHPPAYLAEARVHLLAEIEGRKDLMEWMKGELSQMASDMLGPI